MRTYCKYPAKQQSFATKDYAKVMCQQLQNEISSGTVKFKHYPDARTEQIHLIEDIPK